MSPTEYAERILFSATLEEKLSVVPTSEIEFDVEIPTAIASKDITPGRPEALNFPDRKSDTAGRAALPSKPALVDESARARLLHFFANHELLAAELMALALLKFPDAPRAFRSGLIQTLREEQRHTRWYVERMKQCGVTFGEYPLNRFFWDAVAPMESPLDYVSRLSLTFEQANLDYSKHYAAILRDAGDTTSAKILEQIYRDEIGHVGYGLKWFRHWKKESDSDWEAFQKVLHFPLSPARAKANGDAEFNSEGRHKAGLDREFTRNLALFERSKGRTPNVFFFNPEAEDHIAAAQENRTFQPAGKVAALIRDLDIIQVFLARRDDIVLMQNPPSLTHREFLASAGFTLPEFEKLTANREITSNSLTRERKIRSVIPWAQCPFSTAKLDSLSAKSQKNWSHLFSKSEQIEQFKQWMELPNFQTANIVEKSALSAAGRGNRVSSTNQPYPFEKPPRNNRVGSANRPCSFVEPWVDRVFDFSVQFEFDGTTLRNLGMIQQIIGPRGQYRGSIWKPKFLAGIDSEIARLMANEVMPVYAPDSELGRELTHWIADAGFTGAFGIDGFIYRHPESGELTPRIICEINPRYTMGRVALEISRFLEPGRSLKFGFEKAGPDLQSKFTLGKSGKLDSGNLILNELDTDSVFAVLLEIF